MKKLNCDYDISFDQRYDFSNHMVWARDGRPGGMHYFSDAIGEDFERIYKNHLIKIGKCDTLIGILSN